MSSWVKGECKHTREHLWQNVRSLFGGSGWREGGGVQQRVIRGRTWAECKDLCGSRMLLRVSPIRGTSVVLCAFAGKTVHPCFALLICSVCSGSQRRSVYSHWVLGRAWLGFRGRIFPFAPEGPTKTICKDSKTQHLDACLSNELTKTNKYLVGNWPARFSNVGIWIPLDFFFECLDKKIKQLFEHNWLMITDQQRKWESQT